MKSISTAYSILQQLKQEREMAITAKKNAEIQRDPIPQDLHIGRCFAVYDLGTQHSEKYDKDRREVMVFWEFPGVRMKIMDKETKKEKDVCRWKYKRYTLSLGDKATLRADLESWRGKSFTNAELEGFDLKNLLGKCCQIQIIHNVTPERTYENITNIIPTPKGMPLPDQENPSSYFSFEESPILIPDSVPDWIVEEIHNSQEWKNQGLAEKVTPPENEDNDDLPF